jgi:aminoglycoside phosphotransferase (APT) family kinase protein
MALTKQQLEMILDRALPGEQLREWRALPDNRYALAIDSGDRLNVQVYESADRAATAAAALDLLRGEVDLPIPQLRANDAAGDTVGVPYLLLSDLSGEQLERALPHISDEQLYKLGRRLGEIICRVHRLICEHYGQLSGEQDDAEDERSYALAWLDQAVRRCGELGLLDRRIGAELTEWFEQQFKPVGRQPALVYGDLSPRTILVQQAERGWWISGLTGWGQARGWSPAWDHVTLLDATEEPGYFGLRVGYGNGYDDNTTRTYEQVREHALAPYRLLLLLDRMQLAYARSDIAEIDRRRGMLKGLLRALEA